MREEIREGLALKAWDAYMNAIKRLVQLAREIEEYREDERVRTFSKDDKFLLQKIEELREMLSLNKSKIETIVYFTKEK